MAGPFRLAVLISGNGSNLQAFIDEAAAGTLPAGIAVVVSNRPGVYGLERAQRAGIATEVVDHKAYADREAFDTALGDCIERHRADLVVLAGFMRILTPAFVRRFHGRLLNVHPSLLPKYPGLDTHRRAIEAGDAVHGCSIHYVTEELDGGPVVAQACVDIRPGDTPQSLQARVQAEEHQLFPRVVALAAGGRLRLTGAGVTLDGALLARPLTPQTLPG